MHNTLVFYLSRNDILPDGEKRDRPVIPVWLGCGKAIC